MVDREQEAEQLSKHLQDWQSIRKWLTIVRSSTFFFNSSVENLVEKVPRRYGNVKDWKSF